MSRLVERVQVLRDEVLETSEHGDKDPPGAELFDALVREIAASTDSLHGVDLSLQDAVSRRLAWGDTEDRILVDGASVFDRLVAAVERAFRDPSDQLAVTEAATRVLMSLSRVVAMAAVARAGRDRAAQLREELTQRQLRTAIDRQRDSVLRLEQELKSGSSR
jgi:hypothetical protein